MRISALFMLALLISSCQTYTKFEKLEYEKLSVTSFSLDGNTYYIIEPLQLVDNVNLNFPQINVLCGKPKSGACGACLSAKTLDPQKDCDEACETLDCPDIPILKTLVPTTLIGQPLNISDR